MGPETLYERALRDELERNLSFEVQLLKVLVPGGRVSFAVQDAVEK